MLKKLKKIFLWKSPLGMAEVLTKSHSGTNTELITRLNNSFNFQFSKIFTLHTTSITSLLLILPTFIPLIFTTGTFKWRKM